MERLLDSRNSIKAAKEFVGCFSISYWRLSKGNLNVNNKFMQFQIEKDIEIEAILLSQFGPHDESTSNFFKRSL